MNDLKGDKMRQLIYLDDAIDVVAYARDGIDAQRLLHNVPIINSEVAEVIRCKDCIHKPTGSGANHEIEFPDTVCPCQCDDYWYSWKPDEDWFCANAERENKVVMKE